jgi:1-deoxy-D-xylulose-5-phosphate synthase
MTLYHGVDGIEVVTDANPSYTEIVARKLLDLRKSVEFKLISPAMISSSKLTKFKEEYPNDCFDVGIAESHAAVMAAGMAIGNVKSVLMMYSTFAQRAFDQLLNDITRQNLDVFVMLDRAGVVGKDGPTHQGVYDLAMLSLMPNIKIMMGRNASETKGLVTYGMKHNGPIALRYPKLTTIDSDEVMIENESWEIVKEGSKGYIISYGPDVERILSIINENNLDLTLKTPVLFVLLMKNYYYK